MICITFKILNINKVTTDNGPEFGVWMTKYGTPEPQTFFTSKAHGYAFMSGKAAITDPKTGGKGKKYGIHCRNGN